MVEKDLHALEKKYELREFPLNVVIEVTSFCNLNCIMCVNDKLRRKKGTMNIVLYKKIIDEIASHNVNTRIWLDFYGEPLITRFKLYYMIDYAKKRGLTNISMNSNGTLLDEEMSEMLLDSGIDFISFDCDGYSKETFEKIRVNSNRDTYYRNVRNLIELREKRGLHKPVIEIQTIKMPENEDEVADIVAYWRKIGVRTSVRGLFSWAGSWEGGRPAGNERIACGFAIGHCAVTWDGDVVACGNDCQGGVKFGNLNNSSIYEIWNGTRKKFMEDHLNHNFAALPEVCRSCTDWAHVGDAHYDEAGTEYIKNYDFDKRMV